MFERHAGTQRQYSMLLYLEDEILGCEDGATDFKHSTFQFRAMKGAAVVWRNIFPDGSADLRLRQTEMPLPEMARHHLTCHISVDAFPARQLTADEVADKDRGCVVLA